MLGARSTRSSARYWTGSKAGLRSWRSSARNWTAFHDGDRSVRSSARNWTAANAGVVTDAFEEIPAWIARAMAPAAMRPAMPIRRSPGAPAPVLLVAWWLVAVRADISSYLSRLDLPGRPSPGVVHVNDSRAAGAPRHRAAPQIAPHFAAPARLARGHTPTTCASNGFRSLPPSLDPVSGRATEVAQLLELAPTSRLVTLTGAGGSGKTRLAQAVATELGRT